MKAIILGLMAYLLLAVPVGFMGLAIVRMGRPRVRVVDDPAEQHVGEYVTVPPAERGF